MRIGILGSGGVARTLGTAFAALGHQVMLGTRNTENPDAVQWRAATGGSLGTAQEAASFGEVVINALNGNVSVAVCSQLDPASVEGKTFIDLANPLDFSDGFPPSFTVTNTDSLGEQVQRTLPDAHVVKALNTLNTPVAVDPGALSEPTDLFICGNDAQAKVQVTALLVELGWAPERVRDLGDITNARGTEAYLALWVRTMTMLGSATFNVRLVAE